MHGRSLAARHGDHGDVEIAAAARLGQVGLDQFADLGVARAAAVEAEADDDDVAVVLPARRSAG
jgi:hypothetical protein